MDAIAAVLISFVDKVAQVWSMLRARPGGHQCGETAAEVDGRTCAAAEVDSTSTQSILYHIRNYWSWIMSVSLRDNRAVGPEKSKN